MTEPHHDDPYCRGACAHCGAVGVRAMRGNGALWCMSCWDARYGSTLDANEAMLRASKARYAEDYGLAVRAEQYLTDPRDR
jgi:hypothetical protein